MKQSGKRKWVSQILTDNSRSKQACFALRAMWKIIWVDGCCVDIRVHVSGGGSNCVLSGCKTVVFLGFYGEKGMEQIIVVVELDPVTAEAFYVEETAVKEFKLLSRVFCALRKAYEK
jgi:hypothetical protein